MEKFKKYSGRIREYMEVIQDETFETFAAI